jgi:hypothetical protein
MSYTPRDAKWEWEGMIDHALRTRDIEEAYIIRDEFARMGDEEQTEYWHNLANKWDKEDWAHDNSINN